MTETRIDSHGPNHDKHPPGPLGVIWTPGYCPLCCHEYAHEMEARIASVFDAIAHGDDAHRAWLKTKLEEHFAAVPASQHQASTKRDTE